MSARLRALLPAAAIVLAVLIAAGGVLAARHRPAPLPARVDAVAATLRCPTCTDESVADSHSAMAQSMRHEIGQQLQRGRTPDQIRSWFESRYGERVLLMPHAQGLALILWVVPALAVAGGLLLVVVWARRRRHGGVPERSAVLSPRRVGVAALTCLVVGAAVPGIAWARSRPSGPAPAAAATKPMTASDWLAVAQSLDQQQNYSAAVQAYRHAFQEQPRAEGVRTGLAFDLVRSDQPRPAIKLMAPMAHQAGPHQALALLVLGLAQRSANLPSADSTLRQFLKLAPHHPAAAQVRRLLAESR